MFVGDPSLDDQAIFGHVRVLVDIQIVGNDRESCQHILEQHPDYVILPLTHSDTNILRLFHELRSDGHTCVIVWSEQTLTAFSGRGYRWRRSAERTSAGLDTLLVWGKWPLAMAYKHAQQPLSYVAPSEKKPAPVLLKEQLSALW